MPPLPNLGAYALFNRVDMRLERLKVMAKVKNPALIQHVLGLGTPEQVATLVPPPADFTNAQLNQVLQDLGHPTGGTRLAKVRLAFVASADDTIFVAPNVAVPNANPPVDPEAWRPEDIKYFIRQPTAAEIQAVQPLTEVESFFGTALPPIITWVLRQNNRYSCHSLKSGPVLKLFKGGDQFGEAEATVLERLQQKIANATSEELNAAQAEQETRADKHILGEKFFATVDFKTVSTVKKGMIFKYEIESGRI